MPNETASSVGASAENAETQWDLWEVFTQEGQGAPHEHAGSVHATTAEHAMQNARDVYARRGKAGESLGGAHRRHRRIRAQRRRPALRSGE
jgi:ring-1,2-phenylacetyl-CoA epoxidase subunit PaaB